MKPLHLILLLAMNFGWAAIYSAYKFIPLSTGGIVTIRFGVAAVCLLLSWPCLPGVTPRGRDFITACGAGLIICVLGQRLQVYGNELGTAGNSAVLMALEPVITSVAAAIFLKEYIGPRRLIGFVLGMTGVALLNRVWETGFDWRALGGSLLFVSSFVCEAAYSIIAKPVIMRASVMKMLAISFASGTAVNLLIDGPQTFRAVHHLQPLAWLLLVSIGLICTATGYTIWFLVLRETPLNVIALTVFAQTIFGVLMAALWVGEKLHWGQLLGGASIVVGLSIGLSHQMKKEAE